MKYHPPHAEQRHNRFQLFEMSQGFFVISPEIRLEVYHHLIASCIAGGAAKCMKGLYFSCRTVYSEMQDVLKHVRLLLHVTHSWSRRHPNCTPMCIRLENKYNFTKAPTTAIIVIPDIASRLFYYNDNFTWDPIHGFLACLSTLRPLLEQSWSNLTFEICCTPPLHMLKGFSGSDDTSVLAHILICGSCVEFDMILSAFESDDVVLQHVDRLVFKVEVRGEGATGASSSGTRDLPYLSKQLQLRFRDSSMIKQSWVRVNRPVEGVSWVLGYDLVDGLPDPKGFVRIIVRS
jgi:hypothetical protein